MRTGQTERMKELLLHQTELNAALDLDKNKTQVAPPAEDDVEPVDESLPQPSPPPALQKNAPPVMRL